MSLVETDRALLLLKPINKGRKNGICEAFNLKGRAACLLPTSIHSDRRPTAFYPLMTNSVISSLTKFVQGA
jgi:hypothetical protein